jgi:hypothetical protein
MVRGCLVKVLENYNCEVCEDGSIYHAGDVLGEYELSMRIGLGGYPSVRINYDGNTSSLYVHRLVGLAFLPKEEGKDFINHKNGDKLNCHRSNLEWSTHGENVKHAYDTGLINKELLGRKVINTETGEIYFSVKEASLANNIKYPTLKNYLNGNRANKTSFAFLESC